jgi:hypothetical protein
LLRNPVPLSHAAAAGANLTGLVGIVDVGMSGHAPAEQSAAAVPMSARMWRRSSVADEIEMDLVPVSQEVSATVKVRFGDEPAGLPLKNKEERAEEVPPSSQGRAAVPGGLQSLEPDLPQIACAAVNRI